MKQATLSFKRKASPEIVSLISDEEVDQAKSPARKRPKQQSSPEPFAPVAGPSSASPLSIAPPSFDLSTGYSEVEPRVIKKYAGTSTNSLDLLYFSPKAFLSAPVRKQLFEYLRNEFPWYRVTYQKGPMTIKTPRYTCVWGQDETGESPTSSKYKIKPRPLPTMLKTLKDYVESRTGAHYNFVLVNYYADGKDSISFHSDDESFLGPLPNIASLSLGSTRDFQLKHKTDKSIPVEKFALEAGTMIVMRGKTQSEWLHALPKRAKAEGRMNITFRKAISVAGTNNYYRYNVHTGPVHRWKNGQMQET